MPLSNCAACSARFKHEEKVLYNEIKDISVCNNSKCRDKWERSHKKQTDIVSDWIERIHQVECFEAHGCLLGKIELKPTKDSRVVVVCQVNMPGNVPADELKDFLNQSIRVEMSRTFIIDPKDAKKKKK